eukprot:153835-Hanusia_phi.AAC.1
MSDFEAAKSILRLSGIRFRGQKLEITCNEASMGSQVTQPPWSGWMSPGAKVAGPVLPDHLKQQIHQGLLPLFRVMYSTPSPPLQRRFLSLLPLLSLLAPSPRPRSPGLNGRGWQAEAKMLLCENLAGRWQASEQT